MSRKTGDLGEALAANVLMGKGFEVLERNYRTRYGEIDLVARSGAALVFVEVKARRGGEYGDPLEAITARKREQVRLMAEQYLAEKGEGFVQGFEEIRFDAMGILFHREGSEVRHVVDAF